MPFPAPASTPVAALKLSTQPENMFYVIDTMMMFTDIIYLVLVPSMKQPQCWV